MSVSPILRAVIGAAALLATPALASAQFTLTGQLVEQLPGGSIPLGELSSLNPNSVSVARIDSEGDFDLLAARSVSPCASTTTTNCISQNGAFNVTNLPNGVYAVSVYFPATHMPKLVNVTLDGDTAMGTISLIRTPFTVQPTLGPIPAAGGAVPLSVRVRALWNVPPIPITARINVSQQGSDGSPGSIERPNRIAFTWPAGLTDTGNVPLAPVDVAANAPAGASTCVQVVIALAGQPGFTLGSETVCRGKQP